MRFSNEGLGCWALAAIVAVACSGKLQNVGDINDAAGKGANVQAGAGANAMLLPNRDGAGGDATVLAGNGGQPDSPLITDVACEGCELVAEGSTIRDVATDADNVYWVEYGTFDELGNYQDNGRVMSMPLAGGQPVVVADGLGGPTGVEVSSSHIYFAIERQPAPAIGGQLLRAPRGGGAADVLGELPTQDFGAIFVFDWFERSFWVHEGVAYWLYNSVYRLPEIEEGPAPQFVVSGTTQFFGLFGDASNLYLSTLPGISKMPYAGGQLEDVITTPIVNLAPTYASFSSDGEYIYALDSEGADEASPAPSYVVRAPISGGEWKRLAKYPGRTTHLVLDGADYFVNPAMFAGNERVGCSIVQGKLGDSAAKTTLVTLPTSILETPAGNCMVPWAASTTSLYVANAGSLYRVPRAE
jgi:hypothetical protein